MLPLPIDIVEFVDAAGVSPFTDWFDGLDVIAAAKVTVAITRLGLGNLSSVKSVGAGVSEVKIDFGPGYRVYFARDGAALVILLGGGTKKRQQNDIERALARWTDYKARKKGSS